MLNPYHEKINIREILDIQKHQYQQVLGLEVEIPANTQQENSLNITGLGHFMLLSFTGDYTTKTGETTDDDICEISMQLLDGTNSRPLFNDLIPLNIILSPGRRQILAADGSYSNELYLEYGFIYTFPINGSIQVRLNNEADYANIVRLAFKGIRIYPTAR